MKVHERIIQSEGLLLMEADCTVAMANLPAECVDSIVTDPPYGLEFMGKEWDKLSGQDWHYKWALAAFRLLKPGGHALIFGGTRTYHRLACAVEDAGFEIRDSIHWLYGSGFPKSLDVSKAIDKAAGAKRKVVGEKHGGAYSSGTENIGIGIISQSGQVRGNDFGKITAPTTDAAKQWDGWGTALKPAHEPILLARKPLGEKTVAVNVLKHGTGGLNIDGGRIGVTDMDRLDKNRAAALGRQDDYSGGVALMAAGTDQGGKRVSKQGVGRWPANLILQHGDDCSDDQCVPGCPVVELDEPSRFFYQAKSSSSERNEGCDDLYWARTKSGHTLIIQSEYEALDPKQRAHGNIHPTVKPISLMRYLIRLVTPPGGIVLDPFLGSGTTALAANLEGFGCLAMESDPTFVLVARARWSGLHEGG